MQRLWSVGVAVGIVAVTVWTVISRHRSRRSRPRRRAELGTISDAWLHDPRNYPAE